MAARSPADEPRRLVAPKDSRSTGSATDEGREIPSVRAAGEMSRSECAARLAVLLRWT